MSDWSLNVAKLIAEYGEAERLAAVTEFDARKGGEGHRIIARRYATARDSARAALHYALGLPPPKTQETNT